MRDANVSKTDQEKAESVPSRSFADDFFAARVPWTVRIGAGSDVGKRRRSNEDHYLVVRRNRGRQILSTNLPMPPTAFPEEYTFLLVVADGVGGEAFGEFASQLALETALELAGNATSWVMRFTHLDAVQMRARIDAYAEQMQATLRKYIEAYPRLQGMATTWTSAYVVPPQAIVAHVGDSRAYLFRCDRLQQITRDDTVAQELADAGVPTEAVAQFTHVLTHSLGGESTQVDMKIYPCPLQPGDRLLLCTDGLSGYVSEAAMCDVLRRDSDPQSACDTLIQCALEQGGKDNVTVIVCDLLDPAPPQTETSEFVP